MGTIRHKKRSRLGFTLLETLLALAISGVVLGIIYSTWQTFFAVYKSSEERDAGSTQALRTLQTIMRDLSCGFYVYGDAPSLELLPPETTHPGSTLTLFSLLPDTDQTDPILWRLVESVRYMVRPDSEGAFELLSVRIPLSPVTTNQATTNLLLSGLTRFDVQLLYNNSWQDRMHCAAPDQWPQAARISLLLKGANQPEEAECLMPAGLTITSRVQRTGAITPEK